MIAVIYAVVTKPLATLRARWIFSGLTYGVVINFVMNYVVLPLSAWKATPHFAFAKFIKEIPAMLLFGLIVAFFCRRLAELRVAPVDPFLAWNSAAPISISLNDARIDREAFASNQTLCHASLHDALKYVSEYIALTETTVPVL